MPTRACQDRQPRGLAGSSRIVGASPIHATAGRDGQGRGALAAAASVFASFESFPLQSFEIADVSLVEGTIAGCNYSFFFSSPRNGIEEADGSIPFSLVPRRGSGPCDVIGLDLLWPGFGGGCDCALTGPPRRGRSTCASGGESDTDRGDAIYPGDRS